VNLPLLHFQKIELLQAAVKVVPGLRPAVSRVVLLLVGPRIGKDGSASVGRDVGERVKDSGKVASDNVRRLCSNRKYIDATKQVI
jgi:hypothetical protein